MPLPKHLKVMGRTYKVVEGPTLPADELGVEDAWGVSDHAQELIGLKSTLKKHQKQDTLLHEIVHCVAFSQSNSLPEDIVQSLAYGLYRVIRDNPKAVEYLAE